MATTVGMEGDGNYFTGKKMMATIVVMKEDGNYCRDKR